MDTFTDTRLSAFPSRWSGVVTRSHEDLGNMVPTSQVTEKQAREDTRQDHELQSWRCLVFYLCFFGFMAQLRLGESFITPYLLEYRNFTQAQACLGAVPRVGKQWHGLGGSVLVCCMAS